MIKRSLPLVLAGSLLFTGSVFADCTMPEDPQIPEGSAASGADMLKAKKAVESYVSAAESYMDCGVAVAMKERMTAKLEKVVDRFNRELRDYKAKS